MLPFKEYKAIINQRAQALRNNPTEAESVLWKYLRKDKLQGARFLRQRPILFQINNRVYFFIADFCCYKSKLIIEIDGDIHDKKDQKDYDRMREGTLKEMGFKVLRFRNEEVLKNTVRVIHNLTKQLNKIKSAK